MKTPKDLKIGMRLTNNELHDYFKVGNSGGMRKSNTHNCLVIICDHSKSLYDDKWDDNNILHYTGMGAIGPQSFYFAQNKTVTDSQTNGITLYLFERFDNKKPYSFHGECELAAPPYIDQQLDADKNLRDVCIFPLRLKIGIPIAFDETELEHNVILKQKIARKLTDKQLSELENKTNSTLERKEPGKQVSAYKRDQLVIEYALRRAKDNCQLCLERGPFKKKDGSYFLEVHHVIWLSKGGTDAWDNVVALCPNCHRKMHILIDTKDINKLTIKAKQKLSNN